MRVLMSGNNRIQPRPELMTQEENDRPPIFVECSRSKLRFLEEIRGFQRGGFCLAP
jgi:hypothetical protein